MSKFEKWKKWKYIYVHEITKTFDESVEEGHVLINKEKFEYAYSVFNIKTGKERVVCELKYLGRVRTALSDDEIFDEIKKLQEGGEKDA